MPQLDSGRDVRSFANGEGRVSVISAQVKAPAC